MIRTKKNKFTVLKPELKKPTIPFIMLISVIVIGTAGFSLFWHNKPSFSIIDSIYMTFTIISTIGFMEVYPMTNAERVFTMFIGFTGIGSLFYLFSILMDNLFLLQLNNFNRKKKMYKKILDLKDHIIVVGYGRVGQLAVQELLNSKENFVVIDDDFNEEDMLSQKEKLLMVIGDATEDSVLLRAGIDKAKGMIVATGNSETSVFVVISAKVLNPKLFIVARADEYSLNEKLQRAGANMVVNPFTIGGKRLANLIMHPHVVDFLETNFGTQDDKLNIENLLIPAKCTWIGKSIKDLHIRNVTGATVIAIIRNNEPILNPPVDFIFNESDQIVAIGLRNNLEILDKLILG